MARALRSPDVVPGDDFKATITYKDKDNNTLNIPNGTVIRARLISSDRRTAYSAVATQSSATTGADWTNGVVVVIIPGDETINLLRDTANPVTSKLRASTCVLEVEVDLNPELTKFFELEVQKGIIFA